jgi:E3 ubiquitin-protein ligase synoviolin
MAADDPVQADPPLANDEAARRQRQEEEMERLLLAQEHEEEHQDDAILVLDQPQQAPHEPVAPHYYSRPKIPYTSSSFAAAVALVYYALRTRQQWYLAIVYLTSSKWAYIILGNALIASCISIFRFFTSTFLQGLRLAEAEGLSDFFRWNVTETCLALTMFRSELEVDTFLIFLLLILAKCLHWVADKREQHLRMTQEAVVPIESGWLRGFPTIQMSHGRLLLLLISLMVLDVIAVAYCGVDIAKNGPSVKILFGFEAAILFSTALCDTILWNLHVADGLLHFLHDHTSSRQWVHSWLHAWKDHKATLIFAVEVQAQGVKFLFYVTFFAIVLTYYGLPINLFREVYVSFQKLRSRLLAFANYRRLMAGMDRFDSVQTEEELEEAGRVCIICRDDMTLTGSKRLPGCGHVFHKSCLREWLVQQQSCPTCRSDIAAMETRQRQQQRREQAQQRAEQEQQQQDAQQQQEDQQAQQQQQQQQEETTPAAAAPAAFVDRTTPVENDAPPELRNEVSTPVASAKKTVRIQEPAPVAFPCLYRVSSERGAQVWNGMGSLQRTVPGGVAILCMELQWKSFNGRSGMMLRMPDGWVYEDAVERLHSVSLPKGASVS